MTKINSLNAKGLLLKYVAKIILSSVLSVIILNSLFSVVFLKLDLDLSLCKYIGIAIVFISALIISYISTGGFKNNILPLSLISVLPFLLFIIINFSIGRGDIKIMMIKIVVTAVSALISSLLRLKKLKG